MTMQKSEKPYRHENLHSAGLESLFQKYYYILSFISTCQWI